MKHLNVTALWAATLVLTTNNVGARSFGFEQNIADLAGDQGTTEYHENGRLIARIENNGQITLFGVTPEHAAEATWSEAPEYMHEDACSMTFTYEFDFNDLNNHKQRSVGLTPSGTVVYDNIAPTEATAAYFKKLAELAACRKSTS